MHFAISIPQHVPDGTFDPAKLRIASRKSSFVRFKHLFSCDSVLVSPPGLRLRSSALKLEKHMAFVREKEEDSS